MFTWLCRPCRARASGSGEVGPAESADASKLDRTLLFASGAVMERALLGDLLKTIANRKLPIVAMKMMKADESKLRSFYKSHGITKELSEQTLNNPSVVAIIQTTAALKTLPVVINQFRIDHALQPEDVFCSEHAKGAHHDVVIWFSIEELQTKPKEFSTKKTDANPLDAEAQGAPIDHGSEETAQMEGNGDSLSETNPFHETNGSVHDHESTHELVQNR